MNADSDSDKWVKKWDDERIEDLRRLVDPVCQKIMRGEVDEAEARELMAQARLEASFRIPEQMELYDLIYESRFERLIDQFIRRRAQG
jgi:hypothetical protein